MAFDKKRSRPGRPARRHLHPHWRATAAIRQSRHGFATQQASVTSIDANRGSATRRRGSAEPHRIPGLDGIRGLAALYVVVHHCWLLSFPGYPANTGPAWGGWLLYGRLAVVMFI